jgi:hypothetical protein
VTILNDDTIEAGADRLVAALRGCLSCGV